MSTRTPYPLRRALAAAALSLLPVTQALAGDDQYLGEVICGAWPFTPRFLTPADGRLLSIQQNQALFALLGTTYGGDGRTNFRLPDLRGRAMVNAGQPPGLRGYQMGETGGSTTVTLQASNLPPHTHQVVPLGSSQEASRQSPAGAVPAAKARGQSYGSATPGATRATGTTDPAGQNQPINLLQPFLAMNCFIATQGIFPSRQ